MRSSSTLPSQRRLRLAGARRTAAAPAPRAEPRAAPSTGTAEFDGGVGVAAFRPPAPEPKRGPALGRAGVATFDKGAGVAAFASSTSPSIVAQLRRYGLAGVLSYGALNCVWYTFAFWAAASVAGPAKAGLGLKGALAKGAEVLAYTWVGSQATKLLRLGLALALAPLTDAALDAVRAALRLRSKRAAFAACVAVLGGCASAVLVGRTLAWV